MNVVGTGGPIPLVSLAKRRLQARKNQHLSNWA
jgi:hypothetical protein